MVTVSIDGQPQLLTALQMSHPQKLRALAAWYRAFAERAGNPTIWEARLLMAEDLEAEADRIDPPGADAPMPPP